MLLLRVGSERALLLLLPGSADGGEKSAHAGTVVLSA